MRRFHFRAACCKPSHYVSGKSQAGGKGPGQLLEHSSGLGQGGVIWTEPGKHAAISCGACWLSEATLTALCLCVGLTNAFVHAGPPPGVTPTPLVAQPAGQAKSLPLQALF